MPDALRWLGAFFPAALLLAFLTGCHRPTAAERQPAYRIAGTWQWVRSLNVKTTEMSTPSSTGFAATLTLVPEDGNSGTFTYVRSGAAPVTGQFQIAFEDSEGNDFITVEPGFDFLTRNAWITAGTDSLRLDGVFERGHNSTYVRIAE
jgi:hypothetical protein